MYFKLSPYGDTYNGWWGAAWLQLSDNVKQNPRAVTSMSPTYTLKVDVVDQWAMHQIGQVLKISARGTKTKKNKHELFNIPCTCSLADRILKSVLVVVVNVTTRTALHN